jgi:small subunit ribosomal protein S19
MGDEITFKFRGKSFEEIQNLSEDEFVKLLNSDIRRKIKRGFTEQELKLLNKIKRGDKNVKTHCRDMPVLREMIGLKIGIYNGKEFIQILMIPEMIGHRLGEFAPTRKIGVKHSGKQDATKKANAKGGDKK